MKTKTNPDIPESAKQAAMQILFGGILPKDIKGLPTVDAVAKIISDVTDLEWLLSIRRQSESCLPAIGYSPTVKITSNHFESLSQLESHLAVSVGICTALTENIQNAEAKCFARLCLNNLECSQHQAAMIRHFLEENAYGHA